MYTRWPRGFTPTKPIKQNLNNGITSRLSSRIPYPNYFQVFSSVFYDQFPRGFGAARGGGGGGSVVMFF